LTSTLNIEHGNKRNWQRNDSVNGPVKVRGTTLNHKFIGGEETIKYLVKMIAKVRLKPLKECDCKKIQCATFKSQLTPRILQMVIRQGCGRHSTPKTRVLLMDSIPNPMIIQIMGRL
jgi:hypothetical protein